MSLFKDVTISWKGKDYNIPSGRVMGLIEVIEDYVTIEELQESKGIKRAKLSAAYCAMIQYAGGHANQEEIYNMFFNGDKQYEITGIIMSILFLMVPPEHLQNDGGSTQPVKKADATD